MAKPVNKGFTLIEVLLVLFIISLFGIIFFPIIHMPSSQLFDPEACQLKAMALKQHCNFTDSLSFNRNGNINHAQTIVNNKKTCVFQLGMGRYVCE